MDSQPRVVKPRLGIDRQFQMGTLAAVNEFTGITHLTFDCYGTLIDWETGILECLRPLILRHGVARSDEQLLRSFVEHEARLQAMAWRPYREVLTGVLEAMAREWRVTLDSYEATALAESLPGWPPFADTVDALRRLKRRFKLVIVSNTDDALFAATARRLEVPFDEVITAEQVRSYKPGEAHFREALRRLNVPVGQVLHVAQSLFHDHVPARRMGFRTAWVNRPSLLAGTGLAPEAEVQPTLTASDLAGLATVLGV